MAAARVVRGDSPEIQEKLGGLLFHWIFKTAIIDTVIVVIPCRNNRCRFAQFLKAGLSRQLSIFGAHHCHIFGVAIDIVAEENEQLWRETIDVRPDRLVLILMRARSECDAR